MSKRISINHLHKGDCLKLLPLLDDSSIDMILVDLPYGRTRNKWDIVIPMKTLWTHYTRICRPQTAIVLTAIQPFASMLIMSNRKMFRYDWIWNKNKSTGFLNAKRSPLRSHEHILVFCSKQPPYYPQKSKGHSPVNSYYTQRGGTNYGRTSKKQGGGQTDRYPTSVLSVPVVNNTDPEKTHPTQKPVALFEYLIRTYTKPGDLVLDHCIGSGTTAIAALSCGRNFIGMDLDVKHATQRIKHWKTKNEAV